MIDCEYGGCQVSSNCYFGFPGSRQIRAGFPAMTYYSHDTVKRLTDAPVQPAPVPG